MLGEPAPWELAFKYGVFLQTREDIMSDQKDWCEYDESKDVDFSLYPIWLTTDDGQTPQGFESLKEAMRWLKEEGIII